METPPPLPSEDPPKSPSPPLPPPSIQASNHDHERLDFETDAGGKLSSIDGCPPAKRQRVDSQTEGEGFGEDEGPDTLLGSGLAAELLEEGEIFDSESILSRNGSIKSNSQCQDRDGSQATDSPLVVGDDSNSIIDFEDSSGKKCAMEHSPGMFDEEDNQTLNTAELQNDDEQQEQIEDMINTTIQEESKECSLKPAIPSHGQEEFEVIDDLESDGEGGGDQNCGDHDSDDESDDIVYDEDEIDALLDEEMDKNAPKEKDSEKTHVAGAVLEQKEKVLLVDRCTDPFDILPENWVMVTHNSGMPVYLHKKTRVCTLSKPYFLGPSSARKHDIPISAIPCLQYRRALEKEAGGSADPGSQSEDSNIMMEEQQQNTISSENGTTTDSVSQTEASQSTDPSKAGLPKLGVRVETAKDHEKQNSLNYMEVREYCERLFQFKTITVKRFKTWKDRRKHTSLLKKVARPSLPSSTKLIRCAIPADKDGKGAKRKEFVLNPAGKSDICILHEYVQQALRVQPRYIFEELQNSQTPFGATVLIGGEKYGSGFSSSKKGAKLEAAKQTLAILIPEMNKLKEEERDDSSTSDLSLFDTIKIEDPRVTELCIKAGQPGPFQVLCECLKRNYGVGDTQVQMEMKALKHQKSEFIMKVGKHEACVVCKNKREGKQQAAQAILQKMHPHIHTWGSLLRLYDRSTITQSCIDIQSSDEHGDSVPCYMKATVSYGIHPQIKFDLGTKSEMVDVGCQTELSCVDACTQSDVPTVVDAATESVDGNNIMITKLASQVDSGSCIFTIEGSEGKHVDGVVGSDLVHQAVQTQWYGRDMYHKTTQYPEVHYSQDAEERSEAVTVVSPKVPRGLPQYAASYKCAEVRSASGVIYGFCPKAVNPGQSESLGTASLSTSQPEVIQSNSASQVASSISDVRPSASAMMTVSPATNTRAVGPSMRVSPVVLPGVFSPAMYPVGFQYPASVCTPPNYMMTYPCIPQPLSVPVTTSRTSASRT